LEVKDVVWYIKPGQRSARCCLEVATVSQPAQLHQKSEPDKATLTRTRVLQRELATYSDLVDNRLESGDSTGLGRGPRGSTPKPVESPDSSLLSTKSE